MHEGQPKKSEFGLDDYNQPTEPIEKIVLPPAYPSNGVQQNTWAVDPNQPLYPPFPNAAPAYPFQQPINYPMPQPYPGTAYPVLPPAPLNVPRELPPGGSAPVERSRRSGRRRGRLIPGLVRLFFALVQLTLLAHAIFLLFRIPVTNIWLNLLFQASDLFLIPVRSLVASINLPLLSGTGLLFYLEFLVAIFAYWLFSRLLVGLLRIFLS